MEKREMESLLIMVDRFTSYVQSKPKNPSRQIQRINHFKAMVLMEMDRAGKSGESTITT